MSSTYRSLPHPSTDRAWWETFARDHAEWLAQLDAVCTAAPEVPPSPCSRSDFAVLRTNDCGRLEHNKPNAQGVLAALALQRCISGWAGTHRTRTLYPAPSKIEGTDDKLRAWLEAFLTRPTWVDATQWAAHDPPENGLPALDLAACEMALLMAELREVLKPWMDTVSETLADSIVTELDRRVLTPYAAGLEVWRPHADRSNWLGVCAGSILAACESLATQGQPRPQAHAHALADLNRFLRDGFTRGGECAEGMGDWCYGVGRACHGWSRLAQEEFEARVDLDRFRRIADYPRRAHLFQDYFYSSNEADLRAHAPLDFVPWLAAASGNEFLAWWAEHFGAPAQRHLGPAWSPLKSKASMPIPEAGAPPTDSIAVLKHVSHGTRFLLLEDQQVGKLRLHTPQGELLVCLNGGHNAEHHNHNDLGHFMVALNEHVIVPDLGMPAYRAADGFPCADSSGHCCPQIGEHEQCAGAEAAGKVLAWQPDAAIPRLVLDLTAAYPPEAGLKHWTRTLEHFHANQDAYGSLPERAVITDVFKTQAPRQKITLRFWTLTPFKEPGERVEGGGFKLHLGALVCEISPAPYALMPNPFTPEELLLRDFKDRPLWRIEAVYRTGEDGSLTVETRFYV